MKRASVVLLLMLALTVLVSASAFAAEPAKPAEPAKAAEPAAAGEAAKPPEEAKPYAVGDTIKPITLKNLDGKDVPVKLKGKVTAMSFFSTSCSACRAELGFLDKLKSAETYLEVVGVSVDVTIERVQGFAAESKYAFDFYLDPDYKVPQSFGFTSSPALVLLSEDGKVLYKKMGYRGPDAAEIMKAVKAAK